MQTGPQAPVRCPKCGATMNYHTDKLVFSANPDEPGMDPELGGYVQETHACPRCGNVESRRG